MPAAKAASASLISWWRAVAQAGRRGTAAGAIGVASGERWRKFMHQSIIEMRGLCYRFPAKPHSLSLVLYVR
ncbi:hypothetical protein ACFOHY_25310 [Rhizobium rosettiformans]|uniref:hypothetical protein n=1 Tax=Rhizobium rosettiformans TaxID=1368430 RepID=UPI0036114711